MIQRILVSAKKATFQMAQGCSQKASILTSEEVKAMSRPTCESGSLATLGVPAFRLFSAAPDKPKPPTKQKELFCARRDCDYKPCETPKECNAQGCCDELPDLITLEEILIYKIISGRSKPQRSDLHEDSSGHCRGSDSDDDGEE
jgi:hypothetical protein